MYVVCVQCGVKRLESTLVHSVKGRGEEVKSLATRGVRVIKLTVSRKTEC